MAWISRIEKSGLVGGLFLRDFTASLRLWWQRSRSRRHLLRLNECQLRDIGIDRQAAEQEARKPFWRA